jgi:mannose-6-phosphate isomerase-like protein (cupin superfamily)
MCVSRAARAYSCAVRRKEIMKEKTLRFGKGFKVIMGNRRVQAAQMVIAPGDSEGGPKIEHAEQHQIRNTGRGYLRTINFYSPPAYTKDGDARPAGKP